MQAEKARVQMELASLAGERGERAQRRPSGSEISPKLVTEPLDEGTELTATQSTNEGAEGGKENVAADASNMPRGSVKTPLPPLLPQRERPSLPREGLSADSSTGSLGKHRSAPKLAPLPPPTLPDDPSPVRAAPKHRKAPKPTDRESPSRPQAPPKPPKAPPKDIGPGWK